MAKFSTYLAIFKALGQILFVLGGQMLKNNLSTWSHNSLHIKWYILLKIQWSLFFLLDAYLLQNLITTKILCLLLSWKLLATNLITILWPKYCVIFWETVLLKTLILSKNSCGYFLGNVWKNWTAFYSIWSHWLWSNCEGKSSRQITTTFMKRWEKDSNPQQNLLNDLNALSLCKPS